MDTYHANLIGVLIIKMVQFDSKLGQVIKGQTTSIVKYCYLGDRIFDYYLQANSERKLNEERF